MIRNLIGRILQIANSSPDAINRDRFYRMKSRICWLIGKRDGRDIQHIPGKECWNCDGSGTYVVYHTFSGDQWEDYCNRCGGSGWFKRPVWVTLDRYRIGRNTFHQPVNRAHTLPDWCDLSNVERPFIIGYIEHAKHKYDTVIRCQIALAMFFDWGLIWLHLVLIADQFDSLRRLKNHLKQRRIKRAQRRMGRLTDNEEVPF